MRVVGYIRVSTEEQASEGVSLAAQESKLQQYAELYEHEVISIWSDAGVSAKSLDRPNLQIALAYLTQGQADGLLIAKLDRLTRSVVDLGTLMSDYFTTYALLSVTDSIDTHSASGRLVLNVLMSVAQWEREAIGERTAEALAHLKAQGVTLGRAAYGSVRSEDSDKNGRRVVVPSSSEQDTINRIIELRKRGGSLRAICELITEEGHKTKRGGKWRPKIIRSILKRSGIE